MEIGDADVLTVAGVTPATGSDSTAQHAAAQQEADLDLLHSLKGLGWRAEQARLAIEHSRTPEASIEARLHAAIKFLGARGRTYALRQAAMNRSGAAGVSPSELAAR